jgi:hypothetical protein
VATSQSISPDTKEVDFGVTVGLDEECCQLAIRFFLGYAGALDLESDTSWKSDLRRSENRFNTGKKYWNVKRNP